MNLRIVKLLKAEKGQPAGMYVLQQEYVNGQKGWKDLYAHPHLDKVLEEYKSTIAPIKDDRLVSDQTFAIRLKTFLNNIKPYYSCSDEELEYLKEVADKLLDYQIITVDKGSDEEQYLHRLNLI